MERDFKGVWIPREVYLDKKLSWIQKILFIEIDSYTKNGKECFFSNAYLSQFLGISPRQITENITKLKKMGYIEETHFDGRKRYLKSNLSICLADQNKTSCQDRGKPLGRIEENFHHTNIDTNIITKSDTNKRESAKAPHFQKPQKEEVLKVFQENTQDVKKSISETEKFFDYYDSVGWKIGGKSQMKDWKAAVRNWVRRMESYRKPEKLSKEPEKINPILVCYTWETISNEARRGHKNKQAYIEMWEMIAKRKGQTIKWEASPWAKQKQG